MGTVKFNNNGISPSIRDQRKLKEFLISVFYSEEVDFKSVSYIFCKDDFMLGLNKEFLIHDTYTDIITFTLSSIHSSIIAEIYISVERVIENAKKLKNDYYDELHRVMIHGILHLCGYSDHTTEEKFQMREKEDFYLLKLFHVKHSA